jgi:hypothetical protein
VYPDGAVGVGVCRTRQVEYRVYGIGLVRRHSDSTS